MSSSVDTRPEPVSTVPLSGIPVTQNGGKSDGHIPGEAGFWILILGEMTVFGLLFGVYLDARAKDPALFDLSQHHLDQTYGAINTLLLLSSSLMVVVAVRALRHGVVNVAPKLLVGAISCGVAFGFMKYLEWGAHLRDGLDPSTNDFWMYYYVLTGLHLFHVIVGVVVLTFLWRRSRRPRLTQRQFAFVEGGACFWHMVDLLWIVIFPLLYLVK